VHETVEWSQYEVVISESKPEDGIVKIQVAPVIYNRGKVILEPLIATSISRIPVVALSNPTASKSSWRPDSMAANRPTSPPALRLAPAPVLDAYDARRPVMPTREKAPAAFLDHDPYAPTSGMVPPTSSWTLPDGYVPAPRGAARSTSYAESAYTPIGGARVALGVVSVGGHGDEGPEFG
jgi:hypothetical protein